MRSFILIILILNANLFSMTNCSFQYEYKDGLIKNETKSVIDYIGEVVKTYPATSLTKWVQFCRFNNRSRYDHDHPDCGSGVRIHRSASRYAILNLPGYSITLNGKSGTISITRGSYKVVITGLKVFHRGKYSFSSFTAYRKTSGLECNGKDVLSGNMCTTIPKCPSGYSGQPCQNSINYIYRNITCDGDDKNNQGFGWEVSNKLIHNGVKVDPNPSANNSSELDNTVSSHNSTEKQCKRKYQECIIQCSTPLQLDKSTGKCVASYESLCIEEGLVYSAEAQKCVKENQCGDTSAIKSINDDYCTLPPSCDVANGSCYEDPVKICADPLFTYDVNTDNCIASSQCSNQQIPILNKTCLVGAYNKQLNRCIIDVVIKCPADYKFDSSLNKCKLNSNCLNANGDCTIDAERHCDKVGFSYNRTINKCEKFPGGVCGSKAYCLDGDTERIEDCKKIVEKFATCGIDNRSGNLCFTNEGGVNAASIDYKRKLYKTKLTGDYKKEEYGDKKGFYCSDIGKPCTYRLVKIFTENDGKNLCFKDKNGRKGCISIDSGCRLNGSIESADGIRQLLIENNNKSIVAYNKAISANPLGSIISTCELSGKVGHTVGIDKNREIIAATADGSDIKFWDSFRRGDIGVISFIPMIPQTDQDDGFKYEDIDTNKLFVGNFTGFRSYRDSTYAVYNGLISKSNCIKAIENTSYFIAQAEDEKERDILNSLSLMGNGGYNYNNGNADSGSCVVKSVSSKSFNTQEFSYKKTNVGASFMGFACSPLKCIDYRCQKNGCENGYSGSVFKQEDMIKLVESKYPELLTSEICINDICDNNKPYFPYCGNNRGCPISDGVYKESGGTCVKVSCSNDETYNNESGSCEKLGCKDSIERNGKCYKKLNI